MDAPDATPRHGETVTGEQLADQHWKHTSDRTSAERDEWVVAGIVATGLERARLALAVAIARQNHLDAEGGAHV